MYPERGILASTLAVAANRPRAVKRNPQRGLPSVKNMGIVGSRRVRGMFPPIP
jgi:hypothetical protein